MSATVSNKALNTGTVTSNRELMAEYANITVDEATFLVNDALGPVSAPWTIANKALNTATVTNKAIS